MMVYYGDPSRLPSSEAVPHWCIHGDLFRARQAKWRCLLHFHSDSINTLAENGDVVIDGGIFLKTLPHVEYGTERIGHVIANGMVGNGTNAVTIQNHGQWFVAQSLREALYQAVRVHEAALGKIEAR